MCLNECVLLNIENSKVMLRIWSNLVIIVLTNVWFDSNVNYLKMKI